MCRFVSLLLILFSIECLAGDTGYFRRQTKFPSADRLYDTIAWRRNLGSPIRGSAMIFGNAIAVGTTRGELVLLSAESGNVIRKINTGSAITATPAVLDNNIYFSDRAGTLYCYDSKGRLQWKQRLGKSMDYPWGFDNYTSSPVIFQHNVIIGSADGHLYALDAASGKVQWKYNAGAVVRATPTIDGNACYVGDVNGMFHKVDVKTGVLAWKSATRGFQYDNEKFGYDRKAIIGAAAVAGKHVIVGSRDGNLYAFNRQTGDSSWVFSYGTSWVISTPLIIDESVIVGTSDGRFVNAIAHQTGTEQWHRATKGIVWSSAIAVGTNIYIGDHDGILSIIDAKTGERNGAVHFNAGILSSPSFGNNGIFLGTDEGWIYKIVGRPAMTQPKRYVLYQPGLRSMYFKNGMDGR